eukprot:scaffold2830_cov131-Cylindrotheca_fusiformis.AAC.60
MVHGENEIRKRGSTIAADLLKMDIETMHLEARLKHLDWMYANLLRKEIPTWEEMTDLLSQLRQITSAKGIDRVANYEDLIRGIKQKVVQLQKEGKLQKGTNQTIHQKSGLGLAVQLMTTDDEETMNSDDEETDEEIRDLHDRLETLDWEYENLLQQQSPSAEDMNCLLGELKELKKAKGIEKVQHYQIYFESIKSKVLRIYQQGRLVRCDDGNR